MHTKQIEWEKVDRALCLTYFSSPWFQLLVYFNSKSIYAFRMDTKTDRSPEVRRGRKLST